MSEYNKIAVVIPCYNRTDTLGRLLNTLTKAQYPISVDLVFSIDYSGNDGVYNMANDFHWQYGEKRIIRHNENIGLRKNILSCGDLTKDYDAVIILEDDLLVSPFFIEYAYRALKYYKDDQNIAGISLYSYRLSESLHEFNPITNGYDTYFMQWTSSWGQMWTKSQWKEFKAWYDLHSEDITSIPIPDYVKTWSHSWKKFHIAYLVDTNKCFVYPTESYTTIQPSLGIHVKEVRLDKGYIVPLCTGFNREPVFQRYEGAIVYDCFFEIKQLKIVLNNKEIVADLNIYGDKVRENIINEYYITPHRISGVEVLKEWALFEIPMEINVLHSNEGEGLFLYESKYFEPVKLSPKEKVSFRIQLSETERLKYYISRIPAIFK